MLFQLDKQNKELVVSNEKITLSDISMVEKDLEEIIDKGLEQQILAYDIMPIFRERQHQEECDIYALDKDGNLIFYELKRYHSEKENLLQVMKYAQMYGNYNYNDLNGLYCKYLNKKNNYINSYDINDLQRMHQMFFNLEKPLEINEFNRKNRLFIVTNGVDFDTIEKIEYWRKNGVDINAIKYELYIIDNKIFIDFSDFSYTSDIIEKGYHIVNTNTSYYGDIKENEMLDNHWAAACGSQKWTIDKIKKGDIVFLYSSGKGIIAYGIASSQVQGKDDVDEGIDYDHYVVLEPFKKLTDYLSAYEINKRCETSWRFRNTRFGISKENADNIIELIEDKNLV